MSSTSHLHHSDTPRSSRRTRGPARIVIGLVALLVGALEFSSGTSQLVHGAGLAAGLGIAAGIVGAVVLLVFWSARRSRRRQSGRATAQPQF